MEDTSKSVVPGGKRGELPSSIWELVKQAEQEMEIRREIRDSLLSTTKDPELKKLLEQGKKEEVRGPK
jgi:hypothetical protein